MHVSDGAGRVTVCGPGLGPGVKKGGPHRRGRVERQSGIGQGAGLVGGVLLQRPGRRAGVGRRGGGAVPGVTVVPGHLGQVGRLRLQRGREQAVQSAARAVGQAGGDGLADQVVGRRPAALAEPQQPGSGQLGQLVEHCPRVPPGRRGQGAGGDLAGQQGNEPEQLSGRRRQPLHPATDRAALTLTAELTGQFDGIGPADPAGRPARAAPRRSRTGCCRWLARSATAERRVGGQPIDGGCGQRAELDRDDRTGAGQLGDHSRVQLIAAMCEHHGQPWQPVQHRAEQGHTGRICPLQIVDDEDRSLTGHRLQHSQRPGQQQRSSALTIQDGRCFGELREQKGQRVAHPDR